MEPAVVMEGITMAFGPNEVLKGIDLSIEPGKVTAMLGANGAGKSTLIKVLSGVYNGYGGTVVIDGAPVYIDHPTTAHALGIQAVHQKIADGVVPGLSVAENLLFEGIVNNQVSRAASLRSLVPKAREVAAILDLGWSDADCRSATHSAGSRPRPRTTPAHPRRAHLGVVGDRGRASLWRDPSASRRRCCHLLRFPPDR